MIKTLLKKQFMEIFRTYFYNAKKNEPRSKTTTTILILLYVFLMVGVIGGMFTLLSVALCISMVSASLDWMYFALLGIVAILIGVFGSVFSTYSGLYLAKDNDMLLSMPIRIRDIMISRLLGVYLMGLIYSGAIILPAVVVYWVISPFTFAKFAGGIIFVFDISLIVMILSCLLGWVVAKISVKLKNKSFITVFVSLIGFGLYYFICFKAGDVIGALIANVEQYGDRLKGSAYPLFVFGSLGAGKWLDILIVTALVLALFFLTWFILSKTFLKIATATSRGTKAKYKEKTAHTKGTFGALFGKELRRFTSSPNYMLNCGLSTLILPLVGILMIVKGRSLIAELSLYLPEHSAIPYTVVIGMICLCASMNNSAAPSVSLEGKNLWLIKSMPVTSWQIIKAKISLQLAITLPAVILCSVCACIALDGFFFNNIFLILITVSATILFALIGMVAGVKLPNLTWINEVVPIKQSLAVAISLFSAWIYAALFVGLYFALSWLIGAVAYFIIMTVLTIGACAGLYIWLKKRGSLAFDRL